MEIDHKDMVAKLSKPGANIIGQLTPEIAHILHMAIGVSGEVAELMEAIHNEDRENCIEELGDVEFYLEGMCQGVGISLPSKVCTPSMDPQRLIFILAISAGDVLDLCKKIVIYGDDAKFPALREAMGRFRDVIDLYYSALGITHRQALDANIKKLALRYEGFMFTNEAAKNRADKTDE